MGSTPCLLYIILYVVFEAWVINLCNHDIATFTYLDSLLSWFYLVLVSVLQGCLRILRVFERNTSDVRIFFATNQFLEVLACQIKTTHHPILRINLSSKCKPWQRWWKEWISWWGTCVIDLKRWENMVMWLEYRPKMWERLGLNQNQTMAVGLKGQGGWLWGFWGGRWWYYWWWF